MSKHTPGPWFIEADTDTIRSGEQTADGLNPNSKKVKVFGNEEEEANARLIAAAPELLEACKAAQDLDLYTADAREVANVAELLTNAINKAEGNVK